MRAPTAAVASLAAVLALAAIGIADLSELAADRAESARLDGVRDCLRHRRAFADRLAAELAAGRLAAWEAADVLAGVYAAVPGFLDGLRRVFPAAATDHELFTALVTVRAAALSADMPRQGEPLSPPAD